ncbi:MinD/ParA family protein [Selenihalanaerobacter shriftii]|uniref:Flagellar biosynthesis protein FlhG n=1 Tax=Selenihalanaerobacter shriftii TaxID=142842 RepID=A0A1T4MCH0_9FIRM|nr:MinD/ParA family protein [Selenihalanaerobacter shriftii]SJZ64576.1 flagellar biosynthesis protein FlhG [Selenihalanaerobacter shriftii]
MIKDQAHKLRELVKGKNNRHKDKKEQREGEFAHIYTVTSGKGGVGKTNFTVNLALSLQAKNKRVAVIDADLGMGNIDVVLGLTPQYNLSHVINGQKGINEIIMKDPEGLSIIPGISGVEELANLSEYQLQNLIEGLENLEDNYDIILIDTGAGLSKTVISFTLAADEIIVISTPEPTSVTDAYGIIKVIAGYQENSKVNLVVNQIESNQEGNNISKRISKVAGDFLEIDLEVLGLIPSDKNVVKAVKKQCPFIIEFPNCQAANAIKRIRNQLLDIEPEKNSGGVKSFFKKLIGLSS